MDHCRRALLKSREELVQDLDVKRAMDRLLAKDIITQEDNLTINAAQPVHEQRRVLLDMLPGKRPEWFDEFSKFLGETQPWLQNTLTNNWKSLQPGK